MADLQKLHDAVLNGDAKTAVAVTKEAIAENLDPLKLISGTMVPAMDEVGRRFEAKNTSCPSCCSRPRAMKGSLELLRPLLAERGAKPRAAWRSAPSRATCTTSARTWWPAARRRRLRGDRPGRRRVAREVRRGHPEKGAQIVGLSALLTMTMPSMKTTIEALKQAGVRDKVKVMVGGAR